MEPFGSTVLTKMSIIDFRLGSKYTSVLEEVAFSKILKFSQKISILEYSFSKVVGLKKKCNTNFCVAPKNRLVKITKKVCHKRSNCALLQLWWSEVLKVAAFVTFPICIMVLFEIYQSFKGHFLKKLRVSFNLQVYNKIVEVFLWNF